MSRLAYTPQQASDETSIGEATIRAAIKAGQLVAHRKGAKGGAYLILHDDLVAWLKSLPTSY